MALRITVLLVGLLLLANSGADGAPGDAVGQTGASKTTLWSDVTTAITTGTAEDETWMDTLEYLRLLSFYSGCFGCSGCSGCSGWGFALVALVA